MTQLSHLRNKRGEGLWGPVGEYGRADKRDRSSIPYHSLQKQLTTAINCWMPAQFPSRALHDDTVLLLSSAVGQQLRRLRWRLLFLFRSL